MDPIDVVFADGGPLMTVVLVAAIVAALVQVLLTVLTVMQKRIPAPVWLAAPLTVAVLGVVGTLSTTLQRLALIEAGTSTDPLIIQSAEGFAFALYPDVLAMMLAAILLGLSALLGGLAALLSSDSDSERDLRAALPPLIVGGVVGLVLLIWGLAAGLGFPVVGVGVVVLLFGAGCGLAALRKPVGDEAEDESALVRAFVGLLALAGAGAAMVACLTRGESLTYRALAIARLDERETLMNLGETISTTGLVMGLIAIAAAVACLLVPLVPLLQHLKRRRTVVNLVVGLVLILAVAALRAGVAFKTCELQQIADEAEPLEAPP